MRFRPETHLSLDEKMVKNLDTDLITKMEKKMDTFSS